MEIMDEELQNIKSAIEIPEQREIHDIIGKYSNKYFKKLEISEKEEEGYLWTIPYQTRSSTPDPKPHPLPYHLLKALKEWL